MADHLATTTQQRYPWRAVARTALAVLIGVGIVVPVVVTVILDQFDVYLPDGAKVWLLGASAFTVALSGAVTRIIAIPQVDAVLKRIGLSSAPAASPIRTLPAAPGVPTDAERAQLASLRDALDEDDPLRSALARILHG